MKQVLREHVPANSGWSGDLKKGQTIRIIAMSTVDFLVLDRHNLRERFDQARSKVYNGKIFLSTGDKLMSRDNQHFMTIVADYLRGRDPRPAEGNVQRTPLPVGQG